MSCDALGLAGFFLLKKPRFLYFSDNTSGRIYSARINSGGSLGTPVQAGTLTGVTDLAVNPEGTMLFASGTAPAALYGFRIEPNSGALTPTGSDTQVSAPSSISVDRYGLYVAASSPLGGHMVCRLTGETMTACVKHGTNQNIQRLFFSSAGNNLYGADTGTPALIRRYVVNADLSLGEPTAAVSSGNGSIASAMTIDSAQQNLYASFSAPNPNGPIVRFAMDAAGDLSAATTTAILNGFGGLSLQADGRLFACQSSNSLLMGFPRSGDGTLGTQEVLFNVGTNPTKIIFHPENKVAFVLDTGAGGALHAVLIGQSPSLIGTVTVSTSGNSMALVSYHVSPF